MIRIPRIVDKYALGHALYSDINGFLVHWLSEIKASTPDFITPKTEPRFTEFYTVE